MFMYVFSWHVHCTSSELPAAMTIYESMSPNPQKTSRNSTIFWSISRRVELLLLYIKRISTLIRNEVKRLLGPEVGLGRFIHGIDEASKSYSQAPGNRCRKTNTVIQSCNFVLSPEGREKQVRILPLPFIADCKMLTSLVFSTSSTSSSYYIIRFSL